MRGWPKTSGSRGMHVNVRIQQRWTFTEVRRAALAFSREVERRAPRLATSKWWKEERHGVFLDYNQNAKDRTTCSAYSVRPLPDARVSAPLAWDDIPECEPSDYTVLTMRRDSRRSAIRMPTWTMPRAPGRAARARGRDEAAGLGDAPWPPHFRRWRVKRRASRRRAQGRERKKAEPRDAARRRCRSSRSRTLPTSRRRSRGSSAGRRTPEVASHLAVDDVLVDSMRGRSSTWTRMRVNLRTCPRMRPHRRLPIRTTIPRASGVSILERVVELNAGHPEERSDEGSLSIQGSHRC